ncbi:MAG: O-antigen ligase family protein [Cytophagaceae bacterium]
MKIALKKKELFFTGLLTILTLVSGCYGIYAGKYYFCLIPFLALGGWWALHDYSIIYFALLTTLPFSLSISIGSATVDIPSEPLMLCLLPLSSLIILKNRDLDMSFLRHPITLLLAAHFAWMVFVSFFSVNPLHSVKYLLSKTWYITAFFFFTAVLFRKAEDFRKIFWCLLFPLLIVVVYTLIRHYKLGFGFETSNKPMNPFFFNHVLYSSALVIFLPFLVFAWRNKNYNFNIFRNIALGSGLVLFLIGIGFSYTRASWLGIPLAIVVFLVVKNNLMKASLILTGVMIFASVVYIARNYKFMDYAPDFNKTIFHNGDIGGHLKATYQMEDVSGMERIYRWVAAKRMFEDRPILGSGPSTFYPEYRRYTLNSFYTYVSDNPEHSSTHNYFLMVLCEQGIAGFLLFTSLCVLLLLTGTKIYKTSGNIQHRNLAMACTISLTIFYLHLMLNDLVETDKIGSLFFIVMAILVKLDIWTREQQGGPQEN